MLYIPLLWVTVHALPWRAGAMCGAPERRGAVRWRVLRPFRRRFSFSGAAPEPPFWATGGIASLNRCGWMLTLCTGVQAHAHTSYAPGQWDAIHQRLSQP
ncbi:MAG: hypothetical protein KatS3mg058_3105 [Roseiflexus sp.]|nr:MAG: hypothetical protein KatS3mg058_3105 [Roseiflexus sp.]